MKDSQILYFGNGDLDVRSPADVVPFGNFRDVLNARSTGRGRKRMGGWEKLFSTSDIDDYNNEDLHDKKLGFTSVAYGSETFSSTGLDEEPIVHIRETISATGGRVLIAASPSTIYCYTPAYQNWRIIAWGKSGGNNNRRRWRSCQFGRYTFFTNNFNKPIYWSYSAFPNSDSGQASSVISELDAVKISQAREIVEYKGFLFIGNIVMDGVRYSTGVAWSDFENPLAWDPGTLNPDSSSKLAGFKNLDLSGENIIAMKTLGDHLIIYCERSIWRVTYTGDSDIIFNFELVYQGKDSVYYPHTLIQVDDTHIYMGRDDIYFFSLSSRTPERFDFIHNASPVIYDDITSDCEMPVAGYNEVDNEVWFSWGGRGAEKNSKTLVINTLYRKVHRVDHGFSSFRFATNSEWSTVEKFLTDNLICCPDDFSLSDTSLQGEKRNPASGSCTKLDSAISGTDAKWNALCSALEGLTLDDLCSGCPSSPVFIMASESDNCLKQYSKEVYFRERWDSGWTYEFDGYESILLTPAFDFGSNKEKAMTGATIDYNADVNESPPLEMSLKVGISDHYDDEAKTIYAEVGPESIKPEWAEGDPDPYPNSKPSDTMIFAFYYTGRFFRLRFSIGNEEGTLRTGGNIELSKSIIRLVAHER